MKIISVVLFCVLGVFASAQCQFSAHAANNWPPAACSPYAATSPFNLRVPANPPLLAKSAAIVARAVAEAPSGNQQFIFYSPYSTAGLSTTHDCGHAYYFATAADPVYTGGPAACPGPVHIPNAARPGQNCSDHHMAVIDTTTDLEYDFYQFPVGGVSGGGKIPSVSSCGVVNVDTGSGIGVSVTAAKFSELAGIIRGQELQGGVINHALFAVTSCDDGTKVYPADFGVSFVDSFPCTVTSNAPPVGARFWLDYTDAQIAALNLPAYEKTVVTALAHYGAYVGDQGGPNDELWLNFEWESGETEAAYGATQPIVTVAQAAGLGSGPNYTFSWPGIDFAHHLHVLDPCTAQGTCGGPTMPSPPIDLTAVGH